MVKKIIVICLLIASGLVYAQENTAEDTPISVETDKPVAAMKTPLQLLGIAVDKFSDKMDSVKETTGSYTDALLPPILAGLLILIMARILSRFTSLVVFSGLPDLFLTLLPDIMLGILLFFTNKEDGSFADKLLPNLLFTASLLLPIILSIKTNLRYSRLPWSILFVVLAVATKLVTMIAIPILIIAFFSAFWKGKKDRRFRTGRRHEDAGLVMIMAIVAGIAIFLIGGLVKKPIELEYDNEEGSSDDDEE